MKSEESKRSVVEAEIFYAIRHLQYQKLELYVRHKFNLNVISKDGRNGLFYALDIPYTYKRHRMIKYCIENGIDPLQKDSINGFTILNETIARQQIDTFRFILDDVGGEIDWQSLDNQGRTILHQAVETNNPTILLDLITIMNRYRISVDLIDRNGLTPYLLACKLHLQNMANILLKKGHASKQKCDLQTHLNAHEWETIGYQQTNLLMREKLQQEINDAMRNGKINRVKKLKQLHFPLSSFSMNEHQRRESYLTMTTQTAFNMKSPLSSYPTSENDKTDIYSSSRKNPQSSHVEHLPPISASTRYRAMPSYYSVMDLLQLSS